MTFPKVASLETCTRSPMNLMNLHYACKNDVHPNVLHFLNISRVRYSAAFLKISSKKSHRRLLLYMHEVIFSAYNVFYYSSQPVWCVPV